jgi:hypothetical protein
VARHGNRLFVGGAFTGFASSKRLALAAINVKTGKLDAWNPGAGARGSIDPQQPTVEALATDRGRLFVGGDFVRIGKQRRSHIAAFNVRDRTLANWNAGADEDVVASTTFGSDVFAGGYFSRVGGQRHDRLGKIDAAGKVSPVATNVEGTVLALEVTRNTLYVGGVFDAINEVLRNNACAIDARTIALLNWGPDSEGPCGRSRPQMRPSTPAASS